MKDCMKYKKLEIILKTFITMVSRGCTVVCSWLHPTSTLALPWASSSPVAACRAGPTQHC